MSESLIRVGLKREFSGTREIKRQRVGKVFLQGREERRGSRKK